MTSVPGSFPDLDNKLSSGRFSFSPPAPAQSYFISNSRNSEDKPTVSFPSQLKSTIPMLANGPPRVPDTLQGTTPKRLETSNLNSENRKRLLDLIDDWRELGIQRLVTLPQIVVCGEQSSGKSSVLEGITQIPFPRNDDLCTRFATQVVLRRSETRHFQIRIIPAENRYQDQKRRLRQEETSLNDRAKEMKAEADTSAIPKLVNEAMKVILAESGTLSSFAQNKPRFSSDILSIEISGPDQSHLSVVDLPGYINSTETGDNAHEIEIIKSMVRNFIRDQRTIILAVHPAPNDLANSTIFQEARLVDSSGLRTLGILTKPDLVNPGAEKKVLSILENEKAQLALGWFIVRNRSQAELDTCIACDERAIKEIQFFNRAPWDRISGDRVGIKNLRSHLAELLYSHIQEHLPRVKKDIHVQLQEVKTKLNNLGPSLCDTNTRRQFLSKITFEFHRLVSNALNGLYDGNPFEIETTRIRAEVQILNEEFSKYFAQKAHLYAFGKEVLIDGGESFASDERETNAIDNQFESTPNKRQKLQADEEKLEETFMWIQTGYKQFRGPELVGSNSNLLLNLFRQQTVQWEEIASDHVSDVSALCSKAVHHILDHIIMIPHVAYSIRQVVNVKLDENYQLAMKRLKEVVDDERIGPLLTYNYSLADTLRKVKYQRIGQTVKKATTKTQVSSGHVLSQLNVSIPSQHIRNNEDVFEDIHDTLKAYYKVARRRFVDNVAISVIERTIIRNLKNVLPQNYSFTLSDVELNELIPSSLRIEEEMKILRGQIESLTRALEKIKDM
ncbi:Interferon-induced GTP-binding protein Mx1 [Neolecta irregularis DAH-3]|uniref:Interferon-induced GTP-binding protein Mx1 n=1 Tax=Neolecta irregularis (strain DAH-3) TaxID=1198029 RepID=A0A1U7LVM0_NEOID|nr:Interferon-induced GTP-binding protein Mx1 [Neolecta irregularis DAH-3]|eukprot:OLL26592.1 Interferon-induced GTP-binding protein Mx1 [Neolecta irregularis DAH-3]